MRIQAVLVALFWIALIAPSLGQAKESDSQTLQAILVEIRGIHEEIRTTETTQILLTELEMQQSVVNRATENVDSARSRLLDVQRDQKMVVGEVGRTEDRLSRASTPEEKDALTQEMERLKANVAALKVEEQGRATTLQEMQERLKTAQDNLDSI